MLHFNDQVWHSLLCWAVTGGVGGGLCDDGLTCICTTEDGDRNCFLLGTSLATRVFEKRNVRGNWFHCFFSVCLFVCGWTYVYICACVSMHMEASGPWSVSSSIILSIIFQTGSGAHGSFRLTGQCALGDLPVSTSLTLGFQLSTWVSRVALRSSRLSSKPFAYWGTSPALMYFFEAVPMSPRLASNLCS